METMNESLVRANKKKKEETQEKFNIGREGTTVLPGYKKYSNLHDSAYKWEILHMRANSHLLFKLIEFYLSHSQHC